MKEGGKATLLLVDDEPPITDLLSRWLEAEGYCCRTAADGARALALLAEEPADCLLADIDMPGMDGFELLVRCRQLYPDMMAIMISGLDDRETVMRALELGAFSYLLKPFQKVEVLVHVAQALRLQELERERKTHYQGLLEIFLARNKALQQAYAQLQRLHLQVQHQEKLASLGELAAGVAHELTNPLSFVAGNVEQLDEYGRRLMEYIGHLERLLPAEAAEEARRVRCGRKIDFVLADFSDLLAQTKEGLARIRELAGGITEFSRRDQREMEEADVERLLDIALSLTHNQLKTKATVVKRFSSPPLVRCRPGQLVQVFVNLLLNAAQALDHKGTVTVSTALENDEVVVRIADTGHGIPPADIEQIFEPFFTGRPDGTGLGLAISRDIVQEHGGRITVASQPGEGAEFAVVLPVAAAPGQE